MPPHRICKQIIRAAWLCTDLRSNPAVVDPNIEDYCTGHAGVDAFFGASERTCCAEAGDPRLDVLALVSFPNERELADDVLSGRTLVEPAPLDAMFSFFNWEDGQLRACIADDPLGNASRYADVAARLGIWEEEAESRAGRRALLPLDHGQPLCDC